jgi:hypothetical protein
MTDLRVLGLLVFHFVLIGLPILAAMLVAARRGVGQTALLLAIGLAVSGVLALATFYAYLGGQVLGEVLSYLVPLASIAAIGFLWREGMIGREQLGEIGLPLALWGSGCLFIVFLGFFHGGTDSPIAYSSTRFSGQLPSDNDIPRFYTEWFFAHGGRGTPPIYPPSWLVSDRPPLQIGYELGQRPWFWNSDSIDYELIGVGLQQLWILGLWALLSAAGVSRLTKALAMITVLFSDVAIVNGFFVWPKMLPTAMVLAAAALVMTPLWAKGRRDWRVGVLAAALAGLAMMGHGSSVFALLPLALYALWRGLPSWAWIGAAIATAIVVMAPWSAYQKYGDPPGSRLDHWMIAGQTAVVEPEGGSDALDLSSGEGSTDESTLEAIESSYGEVGLGGAIHNKAENFVTMVGGGPGVHYAKTAVEEIAHGHFGKALENVRWILFFYLLPSLGLLLLVPLIMLFSRDRRERAPPEWDFAVHLYAILAAGAVLWGLILFGNTPSRTVVHQGSYFLPVIGLVAGVVGLRAIYPRFANWFVSIAAGLMLILYIPAVGQTYGSVGYSVLAALFAAIAAAAFCLLALRGAE